MNYAQIRELDVANGEGIRTTLFVSGCRFNCKGCFNKEYQDFNYGHTFTKEVEDKLIEQVNSLYVAGLSILGGEPFMQDHDTLYRILSRVKNECNKSIWVWTGYTIEKLPMEYHDLLPFIDVLVDGMFEEDKKDLSLSWRGSSNQRVIDVQKTIECGDVTLYK